MTLHPDRRRLEGQVGIAAVVRQARLRLGCARDYPTLPVSMWTSARRLALLVTATSEWLPRVPANAPSGRTLPETDFEFRGGPVRRPAGRPQLTRVGDQAFLC